HRRESLGQPLEEICRALLDLVGRDAELSIVATVHPNPRVREVVGRLLSGHDRIRRLGPLGYPEFVALMKSAEAVLTDSGGCRGGPGAWARRPCSWGRRPSGSRP